MRAFLALACLSLLPHVFGEETVLCLEVPSTPADCFIGGAYIGGTACGVTHSGEELQLMQRPGSPCATRKDCGDGEVCASLVGLYGPTFCYPTAPVACFPGAPLLAPAPSPDYDYGSIISG